MPRFWAEAADGRGVTVLTDLIRRYARRSGRRVQQAVASDASGRHGGAVQVVTLSTPDPDNVAEFLAAGVLKAEYPDAFAVRIDGDSMAPEIRHGDIVVCAPSAPAAEGRAAVVQLQGQIGVTCKICRRQGDTVHLVPVNEQYPPQSFPAEKVVWALRVLARVSAE
ncbi:MAG: hypothetical protein AMJ81_13590 [Phycisphaerae bacterium SM23_33]|nr:MAG: hypothetical protein AMJ81_13590 [Phycisphaerae bacterium SM23_33]